MQPSILDRYQSLVDLGEIEHDAAQEEIAARLDTLGQELAVYRLALKSSALGWLFGRKTAGRAAAGSTSSARSAAARPC